MSSTRSGVAARPLYLCEKPDQARTVARQLGNPRPATGYIETDGGIVTYAVGHLLRTRMPEEYTQDATQQAALKAWNSWDVLPIIPRPVQFVPSDRGKNQFIIIRNLLKGASEVVVSTDPDREGEMIGYEILVACGWQGPVRRLWMLDTTPSAVAKALHELRPGAETEPAYHAALARSMSDWYVGMNLTRAATMRFRQGRGSPLSIGRVQTPTLAIVVRNHRKILNFKPVTYYDIKANVASEGHELVMRYVPAEADRILDMASAQALLARIQGTSGPLSVITEDKSESPPALFDLNGLQQKANTVFGWSADKTLKVAQELYETHHVLSYPRTECTVLPEIHAEHVPQLFPQRVGT